MKEILQLIRVVGVGPSYWTFIALLPCLLTESIHILEPFSNKMVHHFYIKFISPCSTNYSPCINVNIMEKYKLFLFVILSQNHYEIGNKGPVFHVWNHFDALLLISAD